MITNTLLFSVYILLLAVLDVVMMFKQFILLFSGGPPAMLQFNKLTQSLDKYYLILVAWNN